MDQTDRSYLLSLADNIEHDGYLVGAQRLRRLAVAPVTHDIYYMTMEGVSLSSLVGLTIVAHHTSPAGAMVTVQGSYTAVCKFATDLYEDCEDWQILDALPDDPGQTTPVE